MENATRMRILQAARLLFNTRGYRSVTVQELAEQLGMSKKTIYQFFSGKEEIAAAIVEETINRIDRAFIESQQKETDPVRRIKALLTHVKDEATRFGPLFLMDMEKYLPDLAGRYNEFRTAKKQSMIGLLQDARDRGWVRNIPFPLTADILSVCVKAIIHSDRFSTEEALELFLDIYCRGIAESSSAPADKEPQEEGDRDSDGQIRAAFP